MLVLTRKVNERIKIGDDVEVQVVRIKPGVVRIGIVAPPEKRIVRSELVLATRPEEPDEKDAA